MPKLRTKYICQQCGGEQSKWVGKCPDCGAWNTLEEVAEVPQHPTQQRRQTLMGNSSSIAQGTHMPVVLPEIRPLAQERISVGYDEMNRVLRGGRVAGSLIKVLAGTALGQTTLMFHCARFNTRHAA